MREYIKDKCRNTQIWVRRDFDGKVRDLIVADKIPEQVTDMSKWDCYNLNDYLAVSKMLFVVGRKDIPLSTK